MKKTNNFLNNQKYVLWEKEKKKVILEYVPFWKSGIYIGIVGYFIISIFMTSIFNQNDFKSFLIGFIYPTIFFFPFFIARDGVKDLKNKNPIIYKIKISYIFDINNYEFIENKNIIIENKNYEKNDFSKYINKI